MRSSPNKSNTNLIFISFGEKLIQISNNPNSPRGSGRINKGQSIITRKNVGI